MSPGARIPALAAAAAAIFALTALAAWQITDSRNGSLPHLSGATMGSQWQVTLAARLTEAEQRQLTAQIQALLAQTEQRFSHWREDSELSALNTGKPGRWLEISPELAFVLQLGQQLSEQTAGAFDMTIGEVVNLWGFGPPGAVEALPPDSRLLTEALGRSGWRKLALQGRRARRLDELLLDLSAIAKGYAVDQVANLLLSLGHADHLVDIGGELRISGDKHGSPWRLGIAAPDTLPELPLLTVSRKSAAATAGQALAMATSGDYYRFFRVDGRRYAHLIDPKTGWPVRADSANVTASVTVADASCARADALATALFVMEPDAALAWAEKHSAAVLLLLREPTADASGAAAVQADYRTSSHWRQMFSVQPPAKANTAKSAAR